MEDKVERNNDWQAADEVNEQYRRTDNIIHMLMRQIGFQPENWSLTISRTLFEALKVVAEDEREEMRKYKPDDQLGHYDLEEQVKRSESVSIAPDGMLPKADAVLLQNRHDGNGRIFEHEVFTELVEAIDDPS